MPVSGGQSLGVATGSIRIDTSDLARVGVATQQVGQQVERNLGRINAGAAKAGASISSLAGAFGIGLGAAGLAQFARYAVAATEVATAYERQNVAAVELAGSQAKLNELLAAYETATGGAIDKATALADVTRLQAIGFGDSAAELERFVTAARGISLATGAQQDFVISQLQLAIANQSTMRLDQLGLGVSEVTERIKQLQAADRSLTKEQAYQNAVLGLAEEKFGALVSSQEAQATGAEKLAKAQKDLRLEIGLLIDEPLSDFLQQVAEDTRAWADAIESLGQIRPPAWLLRFMELTSGLRGGGLAEENAAIMRRLGLGPRGPEDTTGAGPSGLERNRQISSFRSAGVGVATPGFTEEQRAVILDRDAALRDIETQAAQERLDATRQYEQQRSETIRQYEQGIAREAQDFARGRARQFAELDRQIADVREESAEREADAREEHEERLAEVREDGTRRIAEIEENFTRQREQAMRDHEERLRSAASRLDARAIAEEQRRFALEQQDAEEAHEEQLDDVKAALEERLEQEREAHEERLQEAREADEERIEDMRASLAEQQRIEDEDRRIQLERQAQDHAAQLAQMDVEHQARLTQIGEQAAAERARTNEEFNKALEEVGLRNERWFKEQQKLEEEAIKSFRRVWEAINAKPGSGIDTSGAIGGRPGFVPTPFAAGGPVLRSGLALLHAGEFVMPAARGGNTRGPLTLNASIVVNESSRPEQTGEEIRAALISLLREAA